MTETPSSHKLLCMHGTQNKSGNERKLRLLRDNSSVSEHFHPLYPHIVILKSKKISLEDTTVVQQHKSSVR